MNVLQREFLKMFISSRSRSVRAGEVASVAEFDDASDMAEKKNIILHSVS